jgi:hypothetical protein
MKVADSQEQLDYLKKNPKKYLEYRKQIENELNQRFKFIIKGSDEAVAAREHAENEMRTKLNNDARLTSIPVVDGLVSALSSQAADFLVCMVMLQFCYLLPHSLKYLHTPSDSPRL